MGRLRVIDISDPKSMNPVNQFTTTDFFKYAIAFERDGKSIIAALQVTSLELFDITDPMNLRVLSILSLGETGQYLQFSDDMQFIFAAGSSKGVYKIDISDINDIKLNLTFDSSGFEANYFSFLKNDKIFLADEAKVSILDISDISAPFVKGSSSTDEI